MHHRDVQTHLTSVVAACPPSPAPMIQGASSNTRSDAGASRARSSGTNTSQSEAWMALSLSFCTMATASSSWASVSRAGPAVTVLSTIVIQQTNNTRSARTHSAVTEVASGQRNLQKFSKKGIAACTCEGEATRT